MLGDTNTYGFNKTDATDLIQSIGGVDRENREWHEVRGGSGGGAQIQGTLTSIAVGTGDYTGKNVAQITIVVAPCTRSDLIGESVSVVDWSECIFDLTEEQLMDVWVWATESIALSLDPEAEEGQLTPCHWTATDRCCVAADLA